MTAWGCVQTSILCVRLRVLVRARACARARVRVRVCFVHVCSACLDFASSTADAQLALPAALLRNKKSRRDKIEGVVKTVNAVYNTVLSPV